MLAIAMLLPLDVLLHAKQQRSKDFSRPAQIKTKQRLWGTSFHGGICKPRNMRPSDLNRGATTGNPDFISPVFLPYLHTHTVRTVSSWADQALRSKKRKPKAVPTFSGYQEVVQMFTWKINSSRGQFPQNGWDWNFLQALGIFIAVRYTKGRKSSLLAHTVKKHPHNLFLIDRKTHLLSH